MENFSYIYKCFFFLVKVLISLKTNPNFGIVMYIKLFKVLNKKFQVLFCNN